MLRKATISDFDFVFGLYMHPMNNPWLAYEPMSKEEFLPVYQDLLNKNVQYIYEHENIPAGICKIAPMPFRNWHIVYLGGVAVLPELKGEGHGSRMLKEVIDFCRKTGYKRIELTVSIENKTAISLYKKAGFEIEGQLRDFTHLKSENRFVDEYVMSILF